MRGDCFFDGVSGGFGPLAEEEAHAVVEYRDGDDPERRACDAGAGVLDEPEDEGGDPKQRQQRSDEAAKESRER